MIHNITIMNYQYLYRIGANETTVGVLSKHQRINLCYCAFGSDGVLRGHEIYTGSG